MGVIPIATIGEAWVKVRPEMGHFASEVSSGVTGALTKVAALAGGIVLGKGLIDGFKAAHDAAMTFGDTLQVSQQIITNTGGAANVTAQQVRDLAMRTSEATGVNVESISTAEQVVLSHKAIQNQMGAGNAIFDRTIQGSVDLAQVMGIDQVAAAKLLGRALDDPTKASGALRRAGVVLTQTQQEQIKTFVQSGNTLAAQKVVLDALSSSIGGAAVAAADPIERLKASWQNLKITMGESLTGPISSISTALMGVLPAIAPLVKSIGDLVGGALEAVGPAIGVLAQGMTTFATAIAPVIPILGQVASGLAGFVGQGLQLISGFLGPLLTAMAPVIGIVLEMATAFGDRLLAAIQPLIPLLNMLAQAGLSLLANLFMELLDAVTPLLPILSQLAGAIIQGLIFAMRNIAEAVAPLIPALGAVAVQVAEALLPALIQLIPAFVNLVPLLIPLVQAFVSLLPVLVPIAQAMADIIVWLTPFVPQILAVVAGFKAWAIISGIIEAVSLAMAGVVAEGEGMAIITTIVHGIQAAWAGLTAVMSLNPLVLIAVAVVAAAYLIYRNWDTIVAAMKTAWHAIEGIMGSIASVFKKNWDIILAVFTGPIGIIILIWRRFGTQIKDGLQAGLDFLKRLPGLILGAVTALPGILLGAGVAMLRGLLNGMIAGGAFVLKWMIELPIILLALAIKFDILLVNAGINLLTGLVNGIKAFAPVLWGWFTSLPGEILRLLVAAQSWLLNTGVQVLTGLVNGIISIAGTLWNFWTSLPGRILGYLGGAAGWLTGTGWQIISGLLGGIQSLVGNLWDFFSGIPGRIVSTLGDLGSLLIHAGEQIIQGLINGIGHLAGGVAGAIGDAVRGGVNAALNIIKPGSPSLTFRAMGINIMEGLTAGILDGAGGPSAALGGILGGLNGRGSLGAGSGSSGAAGGAAGVGRTGPALHIENANFNNEADIEVLSRKMSFAVMAGRL